MSILMARVAEHLELIEKNIAVLARALVSNISCAPSSSEQATPRL